MRRGGLGSFLSAAKALRRADLDVTVDRTNHYLFQPLLHQVATGHDFDHAVIAEMLISGGPGLHRRGDRTGRDDIATASSAARIEPPPGAVSGWTDLLIAAASVAVIVLVIPLQARLERRFRARLNARATS